MASTIQPIPPALPQHGAGAPGPGRRGPHLSDPIAWTQQPIRQELHCERHVQGEEGHSRKLCPLSKNLGACGEEHQRHDWTREGGGRSLQLDHGRRQAPRPAGTGRQHRRRRICPR